MSHLVRSLTRAQDSHLTPAVCYALVRDAHDYLAGRAAAAIEQAQRHTDAASWGTTLKRIRVELPAAERHELITTKEPHHNLVEVINQCATIERLLDALAWAANSESGLADWPVIACHPTTSSAQEGGKKAVLDHDLILQGPDGALARFEVSDVASTADGNRKEGKDLQSLGVLVRTGRQDLRPRLAPRPSLLGRLGRVRRSPAPPETWRSTRPSAPIPIQDRRAGRAHHSHRIHRSA